MWYQWGIRLLKVTYPWFSKDEIRVNFFRQELVEALKEVIC